MKKSIYFLIFFCSFSLQAQEDATQIKATITQLFDAMRKADSSLAKKVFYPDATLQTIVTKKDGSIAVQKEGSAAFLKVIGTPHKDTYDERILSWDIRIDGAMASAWCDYAFYLNDKFLHCGVDAFQMIKTTAGWQILGIIDTRRKENCQPVSTTEIDTVMNRWHRAAATADEDVFFGLMTPNADYIGTDPSEHWKRDELRKWSEKFFAKDSAWDFKPKSRTIYFTPNGQHAWFDELLDTWMGDCRGSGVLVKTDKGWRIEQYVLSMAVLNDLTKDYIKLLKK
jgi:SnoaL-like domain/Putative lumazine-binding